jgi:DNA-binding NtrC family response regulator
MAARKREAASLGELAGGRAKGSVEGLKRLASQHPAVRHIIDVVERLQARPYATSCVIGGEPGTGKEGLAHTLHELMHPDGAPIVSVSTAGRDEAELERELFGAAPRDKGDRGAEGAVDAADGGTLVLDEVVGMGPRLQRRLLELVKSGRYHRDGEQRERRAQLSVFVLTDGKLPAEVAAGRFRHDLYHKLARLDLVLPPLRERPEDIEAATVWMASHLLAQRGQAAAVELETDAPPSSARAVLVRRAAVTTLRAHRWPGNFRELEIVIERALMLYGDGKQVTADDIRRALAPASE